MIFDNIGGYENKDKNYNLNRRIVREFANLNTFLRPREKNISPNNVDRYRDMDVIPTSCYEHRTVTVRTRFHYAKEAVPWIVIGHAIHIRSRITVREVGIILTRIVLVRQESRETLDYILELYENSDEKIDAFLQLLSNDGIDINL